MNSTALDTKRDIQISKALSYLLRHGATKENLAVDNNGYIPITTVLNHNRLRSHKCSRDDLMRVVDNNDKKRFIVDSENDKIAATQGHSIKLKPDESILTPINDVSDLPPMLIHGTNIRNSILILESGKLSKMHRNHIHLSLGVIGKDENVISGMRLTSTVYIYIKEDQDTLQNLKLFKSINNVYLCENDIECKFFDKVEIKKGKKDSDDFTKLINLLTKYNITYKILDDFKSI